MPATEPRPPAGGAPAEPAVKRAGLTPLPPAGGAPAEPAVKRPGLTPRPPAGGAPAEPAVKRPGLTPLPPAGGAPAEPAVKRPGPALQPEWDLLLFLAAPPYVSDTATTALRLLHALLARGARVQTWACGSATLLTQQSLGLAKPPDLRTREVVHPTTAALVGQLLASYPDRTRWSACQFCSQDRGAQHIPEVRVRSPLRIAAYLAASRQAVYIGG